VKKQHISENDRYDYFIDKIEIAFQTKREISLRAGHLSFSGGRHYIQGSKSFFLARREGNYIQAIAYEKFNLNEMIRESLKKKLAPHWKTLSKAMFYHEENYIPTGVRQHLIRTGISVSKVRRKILKNLYVAIQKHKARFAEILTSILGYYVKATEFEVYLKYAEIDYDLICIVEENLGCDPDVFSSFNRLAENVETGFYEDNIYKATDFKSLSLHYNERCKPSLKLKILVNKAYVEGQLYIKEEGEYGTLNRFELRFSKDSIKTILSDRRVKSFSDLRLAFKLLALTCFNFLYKALTKTYRKNRSRKQLKKLIMMVFSGKTWLPMWEHLKMSDKVSTRVGGTSIPKACKNLIPKLAKEGILFEKIGKGKYKISYKHLKYAEKNYSRFKEKRAAANFEIRLRKLR
jgi:hypothetical protein